MLVRAAEVFWAAHRLRLAHTTTGWVRATHSWCDLSDSGAAFPLTTKPKNGWYDAQMTDSSPGTKTQTFLAILVLALAHGGIGCAPRECPDFPQDVREMVIASIEDRPEVVDAAVTIRPDQPCRISLALVVSHRLIEPEAQALGDSFLRLVKSLGPDTSPGSSIGSGTYDYMVGVYMRDETQLALGAKVSGAERITW